MSDSTQVKPFDWRDLPLLHRVRREGLCFHSQMAFTRGPQPLQNALLDSLTPGRSECTIVVRERDNGAPDLIGQVSHPYQARVARLTFVGPADALQTEGGTRLLEGLAQAAGRRGAHNLVAEVDEHSPAFESLRIAGFAIYARQRIWQCLPESLLDPDNENPVWDDEHDSDRPAISSLYQNLVPALVQQVEPDPVSTRKGLVYYEEGELLGYAEIERGSLGVWLHPFIHPAVQESESLILGLLHAVADDHDRPIFLCVRSYQGWMNAKLGRMCVAQWTDQAVMVKRLAARVRRPAHSPIAAFEGTHPEPTAPYAPVIEHRPPSHTQETP
jgi:hypothetical protein